MFANCVKEYDSRMVYVYIIYGVSILLFVVRVGGMHAEQGFLEAIVMDGRISL